MEIGDLITLEERETFGSIDSWTEYLCLEKLNLGYELTIRGYEILAHIYDFEDEDGNVRIPKEIDGVKVSHCDSEYVCGSNLVMRSEEEGSVKFNNANEDEVFSWLQSVDWFHENIISEIKNLIK